MTGDLFVVELRFDKVPEVISKIFVLNLKSFLFSSQFIQVSIR